MVFERYASRLTHLKPTSQCIIRGGCTASLLTFLFLCVSFYKKGTLILNISFKSPLPKMH